MEPQSAHFRTHTIPENKNSRDITACQAERWDKQICLGGEQSGIKAPILFKVNTLKNSYGKAIGNLQMVPGARIAPFAP